MMRQLRMSVAVWPRQLKRAVLAVSDFILLLAVLWLSYALRLGYFFVPNPTQALLMLLAPAIAVAVLWRFGLYRAVTRFLPERAVWTIAQAMVLATLLWVAVLFLGSLSGVEGAPRSIPVLYGALGIIVIAGSRFAAKLLLGISEIGSGETTPVLIYGASAEGGQLAAALRSRGGRRPVGFIDDSQTLRGTDAFGLRVHSSAELEQVIDDFGVREIILAPQTGDAALRQEIIRRVAGKSVRVRTIPPLADLSSEAAVIRQIRDIRIDDLLGRAQVPPDPDLLRRMIENRSILVTGAGGSIGSELARLVQRWHPRRLVLLEANEFALFEIERKLAVAGEVTIVPVLGSISDEPLVARTIKDNKVDVVFHAAAHKHVPLVEANALEGIRNNVFGTVTLAETALKLGVRSFVLISSDKAVRPSSVMGATKRCAELIVADCAARAVNGQIFSSVRFGNVLGSSGSVVQLFREQIAQGGPVILTHDAMTRYFMSIHEAAELIVQAAALAKGGDIMLLDMGDPVPIRLLAETMIRLAGFTEKTEGSPRGDIEIKVTNPRKGEKLSEELFYAPGETSSTRHPKILRAGHEAKNAFNLEPALAALGEALATGDEARARLILFGLPDSEVEPAPSRQSAAG